MEVLFHKDILHVNVKLVCNEEEFIKNVRDLAKLNVSIFTLCVEEYQFNWLNTIIRPILINITIRLNSEYNLNLFDCRITELERDEHVIVSFYVGRKSIDKREAAQERKLT